MAEHSGHFDFTQSHKDCKAAKFRDIPGVFCLSFLRLGVKYFQMDPLPGFYSFHHLRDVFHGF